MSCFQVSSGVDMPSVASVLLNVSFIVAHYQYSLVIRALYGQGAHDQEPKVREPMTRSLRSGSPWPTTYTLPDCSFSCFCRVHLILHTQNCWEASQVYLSSVNINLASPKGVFALHTVLHAAPRDDGALLLSFAQSVVDKHFASFMSAFQLMGWVTSHHLLGVEEWRYHWMAGS